MPFTSASKHDSYNRKEKSLGLLSSNFIKLYDREGVESVGLDEASSLLGVERRRIYDIVNVLECIGIISREAKNQYSWKGFAAIPEALEELRKEGLVEKSRNAIGSSQDCIKILDEEENDEPLDLSSDEKMHLKPNPATDLSSRTRTDNRREKSLCLLTQNFVKLFLTTNVNTISLDDAAKLLLRGTHESALMRTKTRRLYDIANVLTAVNLIEKTVEIETRKPAFTWLGYRGKPACNAAHYSRSLNSQQPKKREFGADITNTGSIKRSKLVSLVDKKSIKVHVKHDDPSGQRNCSQMQQQQSSKGYEFGPFHPVSLQRTEREGCVKRMDWEALVSTYRPQYHNEALSDLFAHYMEAWKSWYVEMAKETIYLEKKST